MNKATVLGLFALLPQITNAECSVQLSSDLSVKDEQIQIENNGTTAELDADQLRLHGDSISLTAEQKAALQHYQNLIRDFMPKLEGFADTSFLLATDIVNEVARKLDNPEALNETKQKINQAIGQIKQEYYKDGEWTLPSGSYQDYASTLSQQIEQLKAVMDLEVISSAFNVMSERMKQEGGVNLTELGEQIRSLKSNLAERFQQHEKQIEAQSEDMCQSLEQLSEQEQKLHKLIPQLKDYPLVTI